MDMPITITLLFLGSYLIGSLNGAKIITNVGLLAAFFGAEQDISKLGSGGAGFSNTARTLGRKAAVAVLLWDMGRGALIAWLARTMFGSPESISLICGIFGMVGHNWPIFFRFQGGKGIAIIFGTLLAVHPIVTLVALLSTSPLLFFKKQMSGFVPFLGTPIYFGLNAGSQYFQRQIFDWRLIAVGVAILAVILVRRLCVEWEGLQQAASKPASLLYLIIYDRPGNDPPPRLGLVDRILALLANQSKGPIMAFRHMVRR